MSAPELKAGKRWVERRFEEIAREFGAPRTLAQEDRWRETDDPFMTHKHRMVYYIELAGHVKRGELTFLDVDLEVAGAGGKASQETLGRHIRHVLGVVLEQTRVANELRGPTQIPQVSTEGDRVEWRRQFSRSSGSFSVQ